MRARALHSWVVASLALTLAGPVRAQSVDADKAEIRRAKAIFARGEAAERAGRWAEAIEALREVARIKSTPGVLFHIANCEEHLGQLAEALADFELAEDLAERHSAKDVLRLVQPRLAALEGRVPRLTLEVDPSDAPFDVLVDGASVPRSCWSTPLRMSPGDREVVARAGQREAFRATVHLDEGASERVRLDLRDAPAQATPPARVAEPKAAPSPATPDRPREAPAPASPKTGGPGAAVIVLGGAAVALAAAGAGTFVAAGAKNDAAREGCAGPATCDASARDTVRALDAASLALWIGAGAAAGTAVVIWATAKPAEPAKPPRASLSVGPARLTIEGAF